MCSKGTSGNAEIKTQIDRGQKEKLKFYNGRFPGQRRENEKRKAQNVVQA